MRMPTSRKRKFAFLNAYARRKVNGCIKVTFTAESVWRRCSSSCYIDVVLKTSESKKRQILQCTRDSLQVEEETSLTSLTTHFHFTSIVLHWQSRPGDEYHTRRQEPRIARSCTLA